MTTPGPHSRPVEPGAAEVRPAAARPPMPPAPAGPITPARERRAERIVLGAFGVTVFAGVALLVLYVLGGQTQLEGVLLAVCLGGLGVGIVIWAQELMSGELRIEARHPMGRDPAEQAALADALTDEQGFSRRRALQVGLVGALGGLTSALAIPVLSLGPLPGRALFVTPWREGSLLVGLDGEPVQAEALPLGGLVTVFPEGFEGNADAQALLIHAGEERLQLEGEAATWAPQGFVVYSKICTHAGCPVGLYRAAEGALICPCHQSTFDVMRGAIPTFGPAARPLPQLPIELRPDGTFVALSDFPVPAGPSFWNMYLGPLFVDDDEVDVDEPAG